MPLEWFPFSVDITIEWWLVYNGLPVQLSQDCAFSFLLLPCLDPSPVCFVILPTSKRLLHLPSWSQISIQALSSCSLQLYTCIFIERDCLCKTLKLHLPQTLWCKSLRLISKDICLLLTCFGKQIKYKEEKMKFHC